MVRAIEEVNNERFFAVYTGVRMPVYEEMRERVFRSRVTPGYFPLW